MEEKNILFKEKKSVVLQKKDGEDPAAERGD